MNIIDQVKAIPRGVQTLSEWMEGGGQPVPKGEAQYRAATCRSCPLNKSNHSISGVVADAIRKQVELKNTLQLRVDGEKTLGVCDVCQCVLRLMIWVPLETLQKHIPQGENERYPSYCWKKIQPKEIP